MAETAHLHLQRQRHDVQAVQSPAQKGATASSPVVKFPNDTPVKQFLRAAKHCADNTPYFFDDQGYSKSHNELLADILRLRSLMREKLPPSFFDNRGLLQRSAPHVGIFAKGGYEFLVAFFAVLSLGGSAIPLATESLPEETAFFLDAPKAICVLAAKNCFGKAEKAAAATKELKNHDVIALLIPSGSEPLKEIDIEIDESLVISSKEPALVIFTSGTTGTPKGLIHARRLIAFREEPLETGAFVCVRPAHWVGGLVSLVHPVLRGCKLHVPSERVTGKELWDIFLNAPITATVFGPWALRFMRDYVLTLSPAEQERHFHSLKSLSSFRTAGALPSPAMVKFWTSEAGMALESGYSATEIGSYSLMKVFTKDTEVTNSLGTPLPGIKVKLSEGNKGELLVWAPGLMTHYLNEPEKTKAAFDEEGYFRTGDQVEFNNGEYFFLGRLSSDYIRFNEYTIAAVQVEVALRSLPYVADACVVPVNDYEVKQLCAAVIALTPEAQAQQEQLQHSESSPDRITLEKICRDLHPILPLFMHPRLLRVIKTMSEIPSTGSQKPIKKMVVKQCFSEDGYWDAEKPMPGVEYSNNQMVSDESERRPWDWDGRTY